MQIVRTLTWILITAVLVAFIAMNWQHVRVNLWPRSDTGQLHIEAAVGLVGLAFFLLGLVPMWLLHRATKWRLQRRILNLEKTARTSAHIPLAAEPAATPVQPEAQPARAPEHPVPPPVARVDEYKPPNVT